MAQSGKVWRRPCVSCPPHKLPNRRFVKVYCGAMWTVGGAMWTVGGAMWTVGGVKWKVGSVLWCIVESYSADLAFPAHPTDYQTAVL